MKRSHILRALAVAYVAAEFFTPGVGVIQGQAQSANLSNGPASTLPLPTYSGPFEASQGQTYLNNLVVSLNRTLGVSMPVAANTPNMGALQASQTGSPVVLTVVSAPGQTVDANAGIALAPNGKGNITLFYGLSGSTGTIGFGSAFEQQAANGVDRCPGSVGSSQYMAPNQGGAGLGSGGTTVTGFVPYTDWLGRTHKLVACG